MQKPRRQKNGLVGGMTNLAILAGYARHIVVESGKVVSFAVQQTNNINTSLPVYFEGERRRPPGQLRDQNQTRVTGHIFGRLLPNGRRVAEFSILLRDRPANYNLPGLAAWTKRVPEGGVPPDLPEPPPYQEGIGVESDSGEDSQDLLQTAISAASEFRPFDGYTSTDKPPLNFVQIAGIVYAAMMAKERDGKTSDDCLEVLVCQHSDPDRAIPVRVYGKEARRCAQATIPGLPIFIEGQFRVRVQVVEKGVNGAPDKVERYPYIHASKVAPATPDDIPNLPEWAEKQIAAVIAARRQQIDERKTRLGKPAGGPRVAPVKGTSISTNGSNGHADSNVVKPIGKPDRLKPVNGVNGHDTGDNQTGQGADEPSSESAASPLKKTRKLVGI